LPRDPQSRKVLSQAYLTLGTMKENDRINGDNAILYETPDGMNGETSELELFKKA
jgi:hypothetical protein